MPRDANGDGAVTLEEFTARAAEGFARIDANGDGQIDQSEAKAAEPPPTQHRRGFGRRDGVRGGR